MTYHQRIDSSVEFNSRAIIDFMGGVSATHRVLETMNCRVGKRTVQKWKERNNMPATAIAALVAYQMEMNMPFPVFEFIQVKE